MITNMGPSMAPALMGCFGGVMVEAGMVELGMLEVGMLEVGMLEAGMFVVVD